MSLCVYSNVCKVAKETSSIKRSWLIDTGCPFDLAAAGELQEDDFIVETNDACYG